MFWCFFLPWLLLICWLLGCVRFILECLCVCLFVLCLLAASPCLQRCFVWFNFVPVFLSALAVTYLLAACVFFLCLLGLTHAASQPSQKCIACHSIPGLSPLCNRLPCFAPAVGKFSLQNLCTRPSIFVWNPMALLRVFNSSATFLVCGGHMMAASSTDDIPTQLAALFGYPLERIRITE